MRSKKIRELGKIRASRMFQKLNAGDRVSINRELSIKANFPDRIHGKTGIIDSARGRAYVVKIKDGALEKKFIIKPIHLKNLSKSLK